MCRFVFYQGPELSLAALLTEPVHSLIHQSHHARERPEPLNGDGFGVGWYVPRVRPEPVLFKEVSPAWNSINLLSLAPVASSGCILAHVRAASPGLGVSQTNCHPFAWGRFCFMHNGEVGSFRAVRRRLLAGLSDDLFGMIRGTTDSEIVFAMILDRLGPDPSLEAMAAATADVVMEVEAAVAGTGTTAPTMLNLCLADGDRAIVLRYATAGQDLSQTLYLNRGERYRCVEGVCRMDDANADTTAVLVSSEPLSQDPGWQPVPLNHMLLIGDDLEIAARPVAAARTLGP